MHCRSTSITSKFDRRGSANDLQGYRFAALDHYTSAAARGLRSLEVVDSVACIQVALVPGHCELPLPECTVFLDEVTTSSSRLLFLGCCHFVISSLCLKLFRVEGTIACVGV